jgi:uncharacterized protein YndB with AHSA1/START domain
MSTFEKISIETTVNASLDHVWKCWNTPTDIEQWCTATPEWHTLNAQNDLRAGGSFSSRMEAKDGSFGFDMGGTYDLVKHNEQITYTMSDNRKVDIHFSTNGTTTHILQTFDAETENPTDMQRAGWQAILDNFKTYAEGNH